MISLAVMVLNANLVGQIRILRRFIQIKALELKMFYLVQLVRSDAIYRSIRSIIAAVSVRVVRFIKMIKCITQMQPVTMANVPIPVKAAIATVIPISPAAKWIS